MIVGSAPRSGRTAAPIFLNAADARSAGTVKTTLPLWIYVRTELQPADLNASCKSLIATIARPPTLIARMNAT